MTYGTQYEKGAFREQLDVAHEEEISDYQADSESHEPIVKSGKRGTDEPEIITAMQNTIKEDIQSSRQQIFGSGV